MKYTAASTGLLAIASIASSIAHAEDPLLSYKAEIIAKAQPDECFYDLYDPEVQGSGENIYEKSGIDCEDCINGGGQPKINQAYVWGMTRKDNYLWYGTGPNVNRLVSGVYYGAEDGSVVNSRGINFSVAEYADSKFVRDGVFDVEQQVGINGDLGYSANPGVGDWRPPDAYRFNLDTETQENLYDNMDKSEKEWLWKTLGLRSAGYSAPNTTHTSGLVFLAGPSITATDDNGDGVIMFAFDANTADCVGAQSFPTYTNIRKWKHYNGQLYTAIATDNGTGQVLRWVNDPNDAAYPFEFEIIGNLNAGGAELEVHDDGTGPRLFVNTWPGIEGNLDIGGDVTTIQNLINAPAGLWRSPVTIDSLNTSHANSWQLVWSVADYEPDLVIGLHYGGGAMASFDGHLYWGTMHVPGTASLAHTIGYGPTPAPLPRPDPYPEDPNDPERLAYEADVQRWRAERYEDFVNSYRAISIWRGTNFTNSGGDIDLLYGNESMPVRMERSVFMENNDPRGTFNNLYGTFFADNVGNLRNVADNTDFFVWILKGTVVDGGDWGNEGDPNTEDSTQLVQNVSGFIPLHGSEGISEATNNYTWTMQVFNGKLYIGTMDWGDLSSPDDFPGSTDGADLYCIAAANEPAVAITKHGMANWSSYGVRTIAADDDRGELYLGMANVHNLLSTKVGDPEDGGWEIQRVTQRFTDEDFDELDDEWEALHFGNTASATSTSSNTDGDPLTDVEEWLAGTDPNDPKSFFFKVLEEGTSEGMQQIEWPSIPNRYYTVCETDDLNGTWSPVATFEGDPDSDPLTYEFDPSLTDAKFFKVIITPDAP